MEVSNVSQSIIPESSPKETVVSASDEKNNKDFSNLVIEATTKVKTKENTADNVKTEKKEKKTDKVENLEDLKTLIDEILSSDDTQSSDDNKVDLSQNASDLLSMLSMLISNLLAGKQDPALAKDNILSSLKSKLNLSDTNFAKLSLILDKITNNQVTNNQTRNSQVINSQIVNSQIVNSQIVNSQIITSQETSSTDIKQEIINLLSSMENSTDKDNKNVSTDIKNKYASLKEVLPEIKQILASNAKSNENTNADTDKKEEKFLNSLASVDKKDDTNLKVTNLMNQFTTNKNDEVNVIKKPEVINQKTLANDVIKTLKFMETNDIRNMTVKIAPKELGEIIVNLTMEAGVMKATITTANKDAYNLIQGSLQDMNSKLVNNDVKISTLSLNIYNEDTTYYSGQFNGNNFNDGKNKEHKNISKIHLEEEVASDLNYDLDSNVNKLA